MPEESKIRIEINSANAEDIEVEMPSGEKVKYNTFVLRLGEKQARELYEGLKKELEKN
jgi:hypothetical protein